MCWKESQWSIRCWCCFICSYFGGTARSKQFSQRKQHAASIRTNECSNRRLYKKKIQKQKTKRKKEFDFFPYFPFNLCLRQEMCSIPFTSRLCYIMCSRESFFFCALITWTQFDVQFFHLFVVVLFELWRLSNNKRKEANRHQVWGVTVKRRKHTRNHRLSEQKLCYSRLSMVCAFSMGNEI